MFIRSSTAVNDCLIALDYVAGIWKQSSDKIGITYKSESQVNSEPFYWVYDSQEARNKAFDKLCAFLNTNYKLRDFT